MRVECFYAFEEADDRGVKRWVFAVGDGPRTPIEGQSNSIEWFQHYCRLAEAHGLTPEQAYAPNTRKRARELKEMETQAKAEAKRARREGPQLPIIVPPNRATPREKAERSSSGAGRPAGETPRPRKTRGPARFKEEDITRAIRAAKRAKMEIAAVRIEPDGTILIIPGTPQPVQPPNPFDEPNDWDAPFPPPRKHRRRG
jgi:hypothetical protein